MTTTTEIVTRWKSLSDVISCGITLKDVSTESLYFILRNDGTLTAEQFKTIETEMLNRLKGNHQ